VKYGTRKTWRSLLAGPEVHLSMLMAICLKKPVSGSILSATYRSEAARLAVTAMKEKMRNTQNISIETNEVAQYI